MITGLLKKVIPIKAIPMEPQVSEEEQKANAKTEMSGFLHQTFCTTSMCPRQTSLPREKIREIFIKNGFTIKEGQTDLKEYVYLAAEELLEEFSRFKNSCS